MPRYVRAMHDPQLKKWNFQPRSANPQFMETWGQKVPPETFQLLKEPRAAASKDDVPMNSAWRSFFRSINDARGYKLISRPKAGWFNQNESAETITWGGNVLEILEEQNGFGRVRSFNFQAAPPNPAVYNFDRHPELVQKFVAISDTGRLDNIGAGFDAYTFIFGRDELWVPMDTVEPFPELPIQVDVHVSDGLNIYKQPNSQRIDNIPSGEKVWIFEYVPRGVNVWGRTGSGWVPLLIEGSYYTSWSMETAPPVTPKEGPQFASKDTVEEATPRIEVSDSTLPAPKAVSSSSPLTGKGMYLWRIDRVEGGDPQKIASEAQKAGMSHVLVKVADGRYDYNVDKETKEDWVPPVVSALRARGLQVWGWHYIYGHYPTTEARRSIERVRQFDLDGFVVNAEIEFREKGMDVPAREYMQELRKGLPNTPIALSTFRYPSYHRPFPFETFLEYCDMNMPQVYWLQANNPGAQLLKSLREYQALSVWRDYLPTGAAYGEHGWRATPEQVKAFLQAVREYNLPGANFWEWYYAKQNDAALWNPIKNFPWPASGEDFVPDITIRYMDALNSNDPVKVATLYKDKGVHVTGKRTVQGTPSILGWYDELLKHKLPNGKFTITGTAFKDNLRTFTWTAESSAGKVLDGKDSIGVKNDKIAYHYTYFTVRKS